MSLPTALLDGRPQNGDVPEIDPAGRPLTSAASAAASGAPFFRPPSSRPRFRGSARRSCARRLSLFGPRAGLRHPICPSDPLFSVQLNRVRAKGEDVGRLVGLLRIEEHLSGADVHGGEQIGGPVAFVVMGERRPPATLHGQEG